MPRQILTPEQIASIPALLRRRGDISRTARAWGVHRDTVRYHARGGKAARFLAEIRRARPAGSATAQR